MFVGSEPRTLDLSRAFGQAELSAPREPPAAIVNPAEESAVDFGAMRDPSRFVSHGTFRGERAVAQEPTPLAPAAAEYHRALEAKVRESGVVGWTRSSEFHGDVNHGGTTAAEYLPASVSATRTADAEVDAPHASWMPADAARGALIRVPHGAQYVSEPERNGQLGSVAACVGAARGGRAATVTLSGAPAGGAARPVARPVPTRTYAVCVQPAVHEAAHRTGASFGSTLGAASCPRRVAAAGLVAPGVALGSTLVARPSTAVSSARPSLAPGATPSKVLVSGGKIAAEISSSRPAPLVVPTTAGIGTRALHRVERTEREVHSARLGAYRLADLNGRVLATDGAPEPAARTRCGAEGGALPTIGERANETHARVDARSGVRRTVSEPADVRGSAFWAGGRAVQPTLRVCADSSRAVEFGAARGHAAPMARVEARPSVDGGLVIAPR
jgi:hypothetical protein